MDVLKGFPCESDWLTGLARAFARWGESNVIEIESAIQMGLYEITFCDLYFVECEQIRCSSGRRLKIPSSFSSLSNNAFHSHCSGCWAGWPLNSHGNKKTIFPETESEDALEWQSIVLLWFMMKFQLIWFRSSKSKRYCRRLFYQMIKSQIWSN